MFTAFATKLIRTISLTKVTIWSLTALLCILFFTLYENRAALFSSFSTPESTNMVGLVFTVGPDSAKRTKEIVDADPKIIGAAIHSTDLRSNEARVLYFYTVDTLLSTAYEQEMKTSNGRMPLFTGADDNNTDVIKLINGQFTCGSFASTSMGQTHLELSRTVKTVCRASIPSYYGYFSGFVSFLVNETPTASQQAQMKLIIEKLANDIYFRDVIPTQRPEKLTISKERK